MRSGRWFSAGGLGQNGWQFAVSHGRTVCEQVDALSGSNAVPQEHHVVLDHRIAGLWQWEGNRALRCPVPFPALLVTLPLPDDLQSELNLPRGDLQVGELAEASHREPAAVERRQVIRIRRCEVRVIQHIEELGPELNIEALQI